MCNGLARDRNIYANVTSEAEPCGHAWSSIVGAVACVAALGTLVWQTATTTPAKLWVLAAMITLAVVVEGVYRLASGERRRSQA